MNFQWVKWFIICFVILFLVMFSICLICSKAASDLYETHAHAEPVINSTHNLGQNYVPSAPSPDRHVIVQIPEEIEKSKPPAYSNFSPPSYEEAFEMFKKSYLDTIQDD